MNVLYLNTKTGIGMRALFGRKRAPEIVLEKIMNVEL